MNVRCPKCDARYSVPDETLTRSPNGAKFRCAKCGARFRVRAHQPGAQPPKPAAAAPADPAGIPQAPPAVAPVAPYAIPQAPVAQPAQPAPPLSADEIVERNRLLAAAGAKGTTAGTFMLMGLIPVVGIVLWIIGVFMEWSCHSALFKAYPDRRFFWRLIGGIFFACFGMVMTLTAPLALIALVAAPTATLKLVLGSIAVVGYGMAIFGGLLTKQAYSQLAEFTGVAGFRTAGLWYMISCILVLACGLGLVLYLDVCPFIAGRAFNSLQNQAERAGGHNPLAPPPAQPQT